MPRWTPKGNALAIADGWRIMHGRIVPHLASTNLPNADAAKDWVALWACAGKALYVRAMQIEKMQDAAN